MLRHRASRSRARPPRLPGHRRRCVTADAGRGEAASRPRRRPLSLDASRARHRRRLRRGRIHPGRIHLPDPVRSRGDSERRGGPPSARGIARVRPPHGCDARLHRRERRRERRGLRDHEHGRRAEPCLRHDDRGGGPRPVRGAPPAVLPRGPSTFELLSTGQASCSTRSTMGIRADRQTRRLSARPGSAGALELAPHVPPLGARGGFASSLALDQPADRKRLGRADHVGCEPAQRLLADDRVLVDAENVL